MSASCSDLSNPMSPSLCFSKRDLQLWDSKEITALTSPETVTGFPSASWVKVMTPVTEESPLRTATAYNVDKAKYGDAETLSVHVRMLRST